MSDSTISGSDAIEPSPRLYNEDLAPARERNWGTYSLFAMWMSDVHSIGGYTFAAGLFFTGLVGWQVFVALVLGITVVFFLMNLTGFAGQATGVPYPVIARISFGVFGANLAALIRAVIAIAWYGIQTWLASQAVVVLAIAAWPGLADHRGGNFLGLDVLGWAAFAVLWVLQLLVIRRGMETVRRFQDWAGPAIWVVMFVLAAWIVIEAGSDFSLNLTDEQKTGGAAVQAFLVACALTITYFSTLLLNFCDFSRFAPDRPTVVRGNFWGLPINFMAFAIVTVAVTAGSIAVFGEAITDPVEIVARINNVWVTVIGAITFVIATIGINVVANFVSASYDLANVAPKHIDFRRGGLISRHSGRGDHAVAPVQQPRRDLLLPRRPRRPARPAVRCDLHRLLSDSAATSFDRRAVPGRPEEPLLLPARLESQGAHRRWRGRGVLVVRRALQAVGGVVGVLLVRRCD